MHRSLVIITPFLSEPIWLELSLFKYLPQLLIYLLVSMWLLSVSFLLVCFYSALWILMCKFLQPDTSVYIIFNNNIFLKTIYFFYNVKVIVYFMMTVLYFSSYQIIWLLKTSSSTAHKDTTIIYVYDSHSLYVVFVLGKLTVVVHWFLAWYPGYSDVLVKPKSLAWNNVISNKAYMLSAIVVYVIVIVVWTTFPITYYQLQQVPFRCKLLAHPRTGESTSLPTNWLRSFLLNSHLVMRFLFYVRAPHISNC